MKGKDVMWSVITLLFWYAFAYEALYAMRTSVSIGTSAFLLVVLGTLGTVTCPWFQHTAAWKELVGKPRPEPKDKGMSPS